MGARTVLLDSRSTSLAALRGLHLRRRHLGGGRHLGIGLAGLSLLVSLGLNGCGSDTTGPGLTAPSQAFWTLQLNQHAIEMSVDTPHNTIQLTATARNTLGAPLEGTSRPIYMALDTTVHVDSLTGLVTANFPNFFPLFDFGTPTAIVAKLTVGGVTHKDTAYVLVTRHPPGVGLDTIEFQPPAPPDNLWLFQSSNASQLSLQALDSTGSPIDLTRMLFYVWSSNPSVANFEVLVPQVSGAVSGAQGPNLSGPPWRVLGVKHGQAVLYAETWYYGVFSRDTLPVTVGYPNQGTSIQVLQRTPFQSLTPQLYFWPSRIDIAAGGTVTWDNEDTLRTVDVVFDDSTQVAADTSSGDNLGGLIGPPIVGVAGNIAPWKWDAAGLSSCTDAACFYNTLLSHLRLRTFPHPGTYVYHSRLYGTAGTIVVH